MRVEWRRRPLFYAALLLSAGILITPKEPFQPPGPLNMPVFLGGKVVSEVETRESFPGQKKASFILGVEKIWEGFGTQSQSADARVRVSWRSAPEDLDFGDVLVVEGELAPMDGRRNPGGFDAAAYWQRRGVASAFFVKPAARYKILERGKGNAIQAAALRVKRTLSRRLSEDFDGRESAFLKALFLGEKSELDQDFKDLFLNTGTMHILAVSGFNIGFLSAVLWLFLKPLWLPRNIKLAVLLAGAWAYCLLVGWQAPVLRATLMATVFLTGSMLGRKGNGLNALGLAACVLLLVSPQELFDTGFQLSFLAVFGLLTLSPMFIRRGKLLPNETWTWRERSRFAVSELFWVSFICYFITLPVVTRCFYLVTPYAVLANFAVVPLSFLLFFFALPYFLFPAAAVAMKLVIALLVRCLFFIENLPGSVWVVGEPPPWLSAGLVLGLLLLFYSKRFSTPRVRALAIVLFCANVFLVQEVLRLSTRRFEMTMLDVGQGDAIYFEFPQGGNLLVDAGQRRFSDKGRWVVAPFLKSKGVRSLDAVLLTHAHDDHVGGLFTILDGLDVKRVVYSGISHGSKTWQELERRIFSEGARLEPVRRGDRVEGYGKTTLSILHPEREAAGNDINNESVVFKLTHDGQTFLLTGDIEGRAMRSLLGSDAPLRSDVLKVPHHGGKAGESMEPFLAAAAPRLSLISAGARNPFGHPAPATLAALRAVSGNRILRTETSGAIRILSDGNGLSVEPTF